MVLADFENLLKETMGLDVASIGSSAIERAVEKRLLACELRETHAYWERVRASEAELQELIEAIAHGYRLSDAVRRQVQFQQGNLLAAGFLPGVESYDVIFCRNVLIYFDRAAQDRALTVLVRLLTPKGVLFVAPSETGLLLSHNFIPTNMPRAFAFRKAGVMPREPKPNAARPV